MLALLIRFTKTNPTLARRIVRFSFLIQDIAARPLRILAHLRHHGCVSIDEYNDLISCYLQRGEEIARLKRENAVLLRQVVARHVRRSLASDDWHCGSCGMRLCVDCGGCHYCDGKSCGAAATSEEK